MGLDRVISDFRGNEYEEEEITPENFKEYTDRHVSVFPASDTLYVYFHPWNGDMKHVGRVEKKAREKGKSFLSYSFPSKILTSDAGRTYDFFTRINKYVRWDIWRVKEENVLKKAEVAAASLGCVHASMVANNNDEVNKLSLIVPGHCLAESLWKGYKTQFLKKEFEGKGVLLNDLKDEWRDLAPRNNLDVNGKVNVFLSKSDDIIPYECGKKLVKAMDEKGVDYELKENKWLGHYGTVMKFYYFPSEFLD